MPDAHSVTEPAAPRGDGGLVRLRMAIAYDGTAFSGWAAQPEHRTVAGVLSEALVRVLRLGPDSADLGLTVAGRTDAGVHATGQVAHIDVDGAPLMATRSSHAGSDPDPVPALLRRLGGVLPPDIRVRTIERAAAGFDARFSALARTYVYRLADHPSLINPLRRVDTVAWPRELDDGAMAAAAPGLLGERDFAAYCKRREGATTVRGLQALDVRRAGDGVLEVHVRADAFCHSMVRSLVGALAAVGEGRKPVEWPASLLALGERANGVAVAPAHGLTLIQVSYPPDDQLAARDAQTRRRRA
ncbi:MAG: tRNA pseudouridine(38-40) synthase TruA [Jatrophihabitantaceae bacterium]|nr:tRNA pseudouridine(38-40) synthase TruA [Jatrophihabitantaceae bacterium]